MRRRGRFGYAQQRAIKEETRVVPKNQRCSGCNGFIVPGESAFRFMLSKRFRMPCTSCRNEPKRSRWYHIQCRPADINKAMGYNPNPTPITAAPPSTNGGRVEPPPKPKNAEELKLDALVAMEAAFKRLLVEKPALQTSKELEAALRTYNGCKSRALRPGTPQEGEVSLKMALKRVLDLVL